MNDFRCIELARPNTSLSSPPIIKGATTASLQPNSLSMGLGCGKNVRLLVGKDKVGQRDGVRIRNGKKVRIVDMEVVG